MARATFERAKAHSGAIRPKIQTIAMSEAGRTIGASVVTSIIE
jgi:hypothetical protein